MGRILAKCPSGHVNEVTPGQLRCDECGGVLVSKGWMPTALAEELLASHGKTLADHTTRRPA